MYKYLSTRNSSNPTATHTELATSYKTAEMEVNASEVNDAVVALFQATNPDTSVPVRTDVFRQSVKS